MSYKYRRLMMLMSSILLCLCCIKIIQGKNIYHYFFIYFYFTLISLANVVTAYWRIASYYAKNTCLWLALQPLITVPGTVRVFLQICSGITKNRDTISTNALLNKNTNVLEKENHNVSKGRWPSDFSKILPGKFCTILL